VTWRDSVMGTDEGGEQKQRQGLEGQHPRTEQGIPGLDATGRPGAEVDLGL